MLGLAMVAIGMIPVTHAQSLPQLFTEANASFFQGDYPTAIARYEALVEAGVDDADVHYNLGTAYARDDRCGAAIVAFQRSLRLSAGDDAAEANLRACQTQLGKRRAQKDGEATVETRPPWTDALLRGVSIDGLGWFALVLNVALFALLLARRLTMRETLRLTLSVSASLVGLVLVLGLSAVAAKAEWFRPGRSAIVLRENAPLREGPDPRARTRAEGLEGEAGRVLQSEGGFVRVRLTRGPEGWMERGDVAAL
jgi:hypothetical protein